VPGDGVLRALAEESLVVRRLRELVRWVGDGRPLTATGRVRLADARDVVELLETELLAVLPVYLSPPRRMRELPTDRDEEPVPVAALHPEQGRTT
jgi:hypothetical protein